MRREYPCFPGWFVWCYISFLYIYIYTYLIAILVHVFVDWNDATGTPVVATQVSWLARPDFSGTSIRNQISKPWAPQRAVSFVYLVCYVPFPRAGCDPESFGSQRKYDEKRSFPVDQQKQQHHMTHSDSKVESMSYMNVVPASPKVQCLFSSLFETLVAKWLTLED